MYYQVKVKQRFFDDNGKSKKVTSIFICDATSVTDAEATVINAEFKNVTSDWEVVSVSETKIEKVIQ